jgi:sulfur dioxygenase
VLIFRQLFDPQSSTYSYLLADAERRTALLIDPVFEQARRDAALIEELGLKLAWTLETHVHADHVTGAWLLRQSLGSKIAVPKATGADGADRYLTEGEQLAFGRRHLQVLATPGHTAGCTSYVLDDQSLAFSGDALLIRGCGRTDFQQGDARALYRSVRGKLFALPDSCAVYPGHDYRGLTATSIAEEKLYNPRLGGEAVEDDFVGYMQNLGLAHPKAMDAAVPANLRCGRPQPGKETMDESRTEQDWAPLTYTFAGIWELQPHWLEENRHAVQIVDVREPAEFSGALGHIEGARLIPLGTLLEGAGELDREKPIVMVCRSGARSAQATVLLQRAGFAKVANLSGGMLRWRAARLPVEGGSD